MIEKIPLYTNSIWKVTLQKLIYFQFILLLNLQWVIDLLHLPEAAIHLLSVNMVFILVMALINKSKTVKAIRSIHLLIIVYVVVIFVGWLINGMSILRSCWALTKTLFLILFFLVCITKLSDQWCDRVLNLLMAYVPVNTIMTICQYMLLGVRNDWLGGVFGIRQGANAYTNIYMCIICTHSIIMYLKRKMRFRKMALLIMDCLLIAALTEITAFYLELLVVIASIIICTKFDSKKIVITTGIITVIPIFIYVYFVVNPTRLQYLRGFEQIIAYLGGQDGIVYNASGQYIGGAYSVSRLNPFKQINDRFFGNDFIMKMVGMGLGNCEISTSHKFLQSAFYMANKDFVYYYFSHAFIYLETGWMGILVYALLFFENLFLSFKNRKENSLNYLYSLCGAVLGLFLFFYNSSIRSFSGYFVFFLMAVTYIKGKASLQRKGRLSANID